MYVTENSGKFVQITASYHHFFTYVTLSQASLSVCLMLCVHAMRIPSGQSEIDIINKVAGGMVNITTILLLYCEVRNNFIVGEFLNRFKWI